MLLEFYDAKHICIANTWIRKADKKNITNGTGCSDSVIDFCTIGKEYCNFLKNVNVITGELQHSLLVVDESKKQ